MQVAISSGDSHLCNDLVTVLYKKCLHIPLNPIAHINGLLSHMLAYLEQTCRIMGVNTAEEQSHG